MYVQQFHYVFSLVAALALWIEDDQLLLPSLYLPALPPQYMPSLLLSLIDGEEVLLSF